MRMWPLTEIVRQSDHICIAKVQKITEKKETGNLISLENELALVENIKGSLPSDKLITIRTDKGIEDEPEFPPAGTKVVLFLKKEKASGRLRIAFHFQGLWKEYTEKKTKPYPEERSLEELDEIIQYQSRSGEILPSDNKIWNFDEGAAQRLWNEGKTLSEQKQYGEAMNKFKESVRYWPTIDRLKHIQSIEDNTSKTEANSLRDEAYSLQKKNELRAAIGKFRESFKVWPDKQLEKHIALLEDAAHGKLLLDRVYNLTPCRIIETDTITVPEDFVITYVSQPLHAEWGGKSLLTVHANGDVVVTRERRKDRDGLPAEETTFKRISVVHVKRIYAYVAACGFFNLKEKYWNKDSRDGGSESLEITANGKTQSVTTYYYFVERFHAIVSALEEETKNAEKRTLISPDDAERIVWELPEVKLRADQIRKAGARPFTRVIAKPEPDPKPGNSQSLYTIYFGEDKGTHTVSLTTFVVEGYTRAVSVYEVVTDSTMPLEEWRANNK
jgi:tetratricopeptide (TPR) repeat protein